MLDFKQFEMVREKSVWIVGIPSGEAFEITWAKLDELFVRELVEFDTTNGDGSGFYAFEDEDIMMINRYLQNKNFAVVDSHNYDDRFIEALLRFINHLPYNVDYFISDNNIQINYYSYKLQIERLNDNLYQFDKFHHQNKTNADIVTDARKLMDKIRNELAVI